MQLKFADTELTLRGEMDSMRCSRSPAGTPLSSDHGEVAREVSAWCWRGPPVQRVVRGGSLALQQDGRVRDAGWYSPP